LGTSTGNARGSFFVDMIVSYDASSLDAEDKSRILRKVHDIIAEAKHQNVFLVDFSVTHCQSGDLAEEMFFGKENYEFT